MGRIEVRRATKTEKQTRLSKFVVTADGEKGEFQTFLSILKSLPRAHFVRPEEWTCPAKKDTTSKQCGEGC